MNSILIELYLPAINDSFDLYIPYQARIGELEPLILKAISDVTVIHSDNAHPLIICDRLTGNPIDINLTAHELKLQNGSKLMLI